MQAEDSNAKDLESQEVEDQQSSTEITKEQRLAKIESELHTLNQQSNSDQINLEKEQKFLKEKESIEQALGKPLPKATVDMMYKNTVGDAEEDKENRNCRIEMLNIEKLAIYNSDNPDYQKKISPINPESINDAVVLRALNVFLKTQKVKLSKIDRLKLFRETLEYYLRTPEVKKPLMHSTSSYVLRKSLEDGLKGGHGEYAGEAATKIQNKNVQRGLSVTHPDHSSAESFQQLFAHLSCKRKELDNNLSVDAEKITDQSTAEVFIKEFLGSLSKNDVKKMLAKMKGINSEDVTEEMINESTSPEAQRDFINEFSTKNYAPNTDKIKKEVLPAIVDPELREELEFEADHPFPCILILESEGKEQHLTTVSRSENPTHIPFEDFYWDTFTGEDIKEIRVPQNQIAKVNGWLAKKGLNNINVVPIEIFEVKRIIQSESERSV